VAEGWDERADVVIVGFGAAGACAAIEAAEAGADVLVLERFGGGGATAVSGGVVYAGGGTDVQRAAGVEDTPEAMYDYLSQEVGDAVSPATLRRFCTGSAEQIAWLAERGVPFEGSLCPYKTSYPTNRHYLYYSGSEISSSERAKPAPRGHRTRGRGTSGAVLFARLAATARAAW
jgi:3-oxo-5alpha-steroid 4-dehydrogenase